MIKSRKEILKEFYANTGEHHIQDLIKYITLTVITIIASIIVAIVSDYIYGIITFVIPFSMIFANTLDTKSQIKNDFETYTKEKPVNDLKRMCDKYKYQVKNLKKLLNTYFTTTSMFVKNDTYDEIINQINILDIIDNKNQLKTITNDFEKDINKIYKTIDDLDEYIKTKICHTTK